MEESSCLIIFENAMNKRYIEMAKTHSLEVYRVELDNNLETTIGLNFIRRLASKSTLRTKIRALTTYLKANSFGSIYLSNAEGYVSKNFIYELKRTFPKTRFVALQHGVFPLKHDPAKEFLRRTINYLSFLISGIFPFGSGFGGIKLDQYYVYSEREKNFLVEKKGWKSKNVTVNIKFIKAELYNAYLKNEVQQDDKTTLFLLQGLHLAGLCSETQEKHLISTTINYLSKKYGKLLVKEHPACGERLNHIKLPDNVEVIDDLLYGFNISKTAYSFFSTSLIDAKVFNIKTVGIISNTLRVDKGIYENFDLKINFEDTIDIKA